MRRQLFFTNFMQNADSEQSEINEAAVKVVLPVKSTR